MTDYSASTTAVGNELEHRVSLYYEALGYQVTKNVEILGHQVDILATKYVPGASTITIAVEVKHRKGNLGVNDLTPFINAAQQLSSRMHINGAVIVTNGRISKEAQAAAYRSGNIRVITVDQLEHELLNNAESLVRVIHDHKQSNLFSEYYPLRAQLMQREVEDAANFIVTWSDQNQSTLMLVGDFGSGKSTVINRVLYEIAQRRLVSSHARYPVILKLKELRRFTTLWEFVEASLRDNQYLTPPRRVFEKELLSGRLVVLLDGFDEIQTGATPLDKAEYINQLGQLLLSPSPCILSSRPTFFESFDEMIDLLKDIQGAAASFQRMPTSGIDRDKLAQVFGLPGHGRQLRKSDVNNVLSLNQLDDAQVTSAISRRSKDISDNLGMTVEQFKARLYEIYDLSDLMRRPLLLDMILNTAASGAIDLASAKQVGPSTLYDVYTQRAAMRDREKEPTGQYLSLEQRLAACRAPAWGMLLKGEIQLTEKEVSEAVGTVLQVQSHEEADVDLLRAVNDVRTCSFLRFSEDGSLSFAHKSYFEFFVAQKIFIAALVARRRLFQFCAYNLGREIMYFLGGYARDHRDFELSIVRPYREIRPPEEVLLLRRIMVAAGHILGQVKFEGGELSEVDFRKTSVQGLVWQDVNIKNVSIIEVRGDGWRIDAGVMHSCEIASSVISASLLDITCEHVEFTGTKLIDCDIRLRGSSARFDSCEVEGGRLLIDLAGVTVGASATACDVWLGSSCLMERGSRVGLRNSRVFQNQTRRWYSRGAMVDLIGCQVLGLWLHPLDLKAESGGIKGGIFLEECRGCAVIPFEKTFSDGSFLDRFRRLNPDLVLLDAETVTRIGHPGAEPAKETLRFYVGNHIVEVETEDASSHVKELVSEFREMVRRLRLEHGEVPVALRKLLSES